MADPDPQDRPFIALIAWLKDLAGAFDAADRGYHDEAERISSEAFAGIRAVLDAHPVVGEALPELRRELDSANPYFDTAPYIAGADAHVQAIRAGTPRG
jgi:hypothetical protein